MAMQTEIERLGNEMIGLRRDLESLNQAFGKEKEKFNDDVQLAFATHQNMLNEVVQGAKREFEGIKTGMQELYAKAEISFTEVQQRLLRLESTPTSGPIPMLSALNTLRSIKLYCV